MAGRLSLGWAYLALRPAPARATPTAHRLLPKPTVLSWEMSRGGNETTWVQCCALKEAWINKTWSLHSVEYYPTMWMDLENIMLSEISQTQRVPYCTILFIWKYAEYTYPQRSAALSGSKSWLHHTYCATSGKSLNLSMPIKSA